MSITHQQARHFRDIGYLRIPDAIEATLLVQLSEFVDLLNEAETAGRSDAVAEKKVYHLYEKNPQLLTKLVTHRNIIENLAGLLGPNIIFVTNRHNQSANNLPGRTDTRFHRDVLQWTRNIVTAVVYLEDATEANGCTRIIPGSHLLPFVGVPQLDGGGTWMNEHLEYRDMIDQSVPVPVAKGGVLLFDALLFHATGPNKSDASRKSIVLGYRSADELDYAPDQTRQILVAGQRLYRGNDRARTKA